MLRLAKTILCGVLGFGLAAPMLLCLAAVAGEAEKPVERPADKPVEKPGPLPLQPHMRKQLPMVVARCGTVAVVKVLSVGEVKPDENPPEQDQPEALMMMRMGAWGGEQGGQAQRARCEVVELIRGEAGTKELSVLCRHFDFNAVRQAIWQEARAAQKDKKAVVQNPTEEDILNRVALTAGETYLLVLMPDETVATAADEKLPVLSTAFFPVQSPDENLLGELRELVKRIRDYENPAELSPEQRAAAEKHLAGLGSPDYAVRTKAGEALLAMGLAARKLLEEVVKSTEDLEVRERCTLILEEIKPLPGAQPDDWAGKAAIRKPVEKPEGEVGAEAGIEKKK